MSWPWARAAHLFSTDLWWSRLYTFGSVQMYWFTGTVYWCTVFTEFMQFYTQIRFFFQYPDRFFGKNGRWTFRIWLPENVPRQYKDICWYSHNIQSTNNHEISKSSHGHCQEWFNYLHREIDICPNQHSATHTVKSKIHILLWSMWLWTLQTGAIFNQVVLRTLTKHDEFLNFRFMVRVFQGYM